MGRTQFTAMIERARGIVDGADALIDGTCELPLTP